MLGQIVVTWNGEEKRLLVSGLIRFDPTDALISDEPRLALDFEISLGVGLGPNAGDTLPS
jgi:hypothetical protein